MRIAMKSPQTPDCRGGVFAVFAKIPPPIPSPAAPPIEAPIPCGDSRMVMSAQRVFVATRRAASRFRRRVSTVFDIWNCVIENGLPARRGKPPINRD